MKWDVQASDIAPPMGKPKKYKFLFGRKLPIRWKQATLLLPTPARLQCVLPHLLSILIQVEQRIKLERILYIYILFTSSCIYEVWGLWELGINIEWEGNHLLNSKFIIGDCWTDETCFENYNDCLNL